MTRVTAFLPMLAVTATAVMLWLLVPWPALVHWAADTQRLFQDAMARAITSIRTGESAAIWALCGATAAYGFVHALGPGHGKVLLGGAAFASGVTLKRMTALTLISSLAQAGSAILMVGALSLVFGLTSRQLGAVADNWLAPASYAAIAALGAYLVLRGVRQWRPKRSAGSHNAHHAHGDHEHDHGGTCCSHAHGPSLDEVATLSSLRDAVALVGSIALRPCTGALFVLVIALRFDVFWVGCLAVVTMGLGTAAFNLLVAWSGLAARRLSAIQSLAGDDIQRVSASLHILGGALITAVSLLWLASFWS